MMKTSKRSKQKASQEIEVAIDWEVRPGGMLVQKRVVGSDPGCVTAPIIKFKVSHESYHHHISLPSHSTFGNPLLSFFFTHLFGSTMSSLSDLKKILARETNLEAKDQRLLFRGKEKGDDEHLDMAGVKDMSKVILLEDPASKERKLVDKNKNHGNLQAYDAVMKVRNEVDKLSDKVAGLETSAKNGIKIVEKEVEVLTELLMKELLKLDGIEAEGEAKTQRRIEVHRVQRFVDILDSLKLIKSKNHSDKRVAAVTITEKWETFESGIGSHVHQTSTKITKDWEQFD
ncbi:unnamed protein product [Lactuca saligna]|uniref:BAG domain-containing protein n=1 Tax=Lactuca saligna TaxID=75948 RepID=A0AA35ZZ25_LACSI|nr:unnamed protein product [Lactuca saligna]